jgi:hypothetical protein
MSCNLRIGCFFFFLILSIKLFPKKIDEFGRVDDMKFEMRRIFYWQKRSCSIWGTFGSEIRVEVIFEIFPKCWSVISTI